jgi:hypothetical protein
MNVPITRFWCALALLMLTRFIEPICTMAAFPSSPPPPGDLVARAGDLRMLLRCEGHGVRLLSLYDVECREELLGTSQLPLFDLTLRQVGSKEEVRLGADDGWGQRQRRQVDNELVAGLVRRERQRQPRLVGDSGERTFPRPPG